MIRGGRARLGQDEFHDFISEIMQIRPTLRAFLNNQTNLTMKAIDQHHLLKPYLFMPKRIVDKFRRGRQLNEKDFAETRKFVKIFLDTINTYLEV